MAVLDGTARVVLGGKGGPELTVQAGDVLLLPAGVGHCCADHSANFQVMGAYAAGRVWDVCRPEETELNQAQERIAQVPDWNHEPV
ncbi:hypothetical protein [Deinococcus radiophilus]|uniref:hypothetical protein n=1 Tax=Deinococcus radiophilus TaxID=32062 RepID=UPI001E57E392|nr:hypothetical protein [Deinococcus radiophilus]UFA49524.1 hypothetical protein LMT64_06330 [Deinococcus radiophilus]